MPLDCGGLPARLQLASVSLSKPAPNGSAMSPLIEADRSIERIVFEYAEAVSGKTGEDFFGSLVRYLAGALHADYVFVGELQPDERIATLAAHGGGDQAAATEYSLAE